MTIDKTINRIGAYREEIEAHLDTLADITPVPLAATSQIDSRANSADLLMSVLLECLLLP